MGDSAHSRAVFAVMTAEGEDDRWTPVIPHATVSAVFPAGTTRSEAYEALLGKLRETLPAGDPVVTMFCCEPEEITR